MISHADFSDNERNLDTNYYNYQVSRQSIWRCQALEACTKSDNRPIVERTTSTCVQKAV